MTSEGTGPPGHTMPCGYIDCSSIIILVTANVGNLDEVCGVREVDLDHYWHKESEALHYQIHRPVLVNLDLRYKLYSIKGMSN